MTDIARRVGVLQDAGHGWLEPESQVALAAAPTSDQQMVAQASAFRQALNDHAANSGSILSSVGSFFGDPVLQKQPSAALALRQYLLQKQGWSPIAEDDLRSIQQKLADNGYLDAADVNGVWTPASQQAYYKATSDHIEQQQTHSGGFSIGHALAAFLPSHWIPALVGMAKALPGELRDLVSEVAGDVTATVYDFGHPTGFLPGSGEAHNASKAGSHAAAAVESALGNNTTAQQAQADESKRFINSINAIITVAPVTRAGKAAVAGFDAARAAAANQAVNDAAGTGFFQGMFTDLGPEAAQRGPGVISKAIYARSEKGQPLGLLGSRLFQQQPVMRFASAPVRALYDPQGRVVGGYYALRTGLAQPTRLAGVQALQSAAGQAQTAGVAQEAIQAVESKAGVKHSALADQIHSQHLIGGPFGTALDLLSATFHGPIATPFTAKAANEGRQVLIGINPSHTVGSLVDGASQAYESALRPLNIGWALHAGTKLGGSPLTVEELTDKYGAPFTQAFLNAKINQFAAAHYAEKTLGARELPLDSQSYMDEFRQLTHQALHDPELLRSNRDEMLAMQDQLARRFAQDANSIHRDAQDAYRQGIDSYAQVWQPATELFTKHAKELVGPHVIEAINAARAERQFTADLGGTPEGVEPGAYMGFLRDNHPGFEAGSLGLARKAKAGQDAEVETQTHRQYLDYAKQLQATLDKAGSPVHDPEIAGSAAVTYKPELVQKVRKDAINYLFKYRGLSYKELEGLDAQQLIDAVKEAAQTAPRDVSLALDASPEAAALVRRIEDAGYKVVAGTDIGHVFTPPIIDPVLIQGYKSRWRGVANAMGLNNVPVAVKEAGMIRRLLVERELQAAINDGRIRVPPSINGARLNMLLLDRLESRTNMTLGEKMAMAAGTPFHRAIANDRFGGKATAEQVRQHMDEQATQIAKGTQPTEVRPKEIVRALTEDTPTPIKEALGLNINETLPLLDEKSARTVADLYIRAMIHEPAWVFGAGKLEDLYRAGFGFLGTKASEKVPVLRSVARLPNATIRARNRYRFQLDPMFSMKRVAKSALKASIPGEHGIAAPLSVRPYHYMAKSGTLDHDLGVLNRVLPMKGAEGFDTNDRLLYEQDAFGLYNPRHHMALRAGELARAGLSDKQIAADLKRTFTYGDRTAFERTLGTIWYPFSFEKTLWRNVGSYMMDRPGSRLLATVAFDAYNALSQHDGIDQWLQDHAPLLREFQKMNAFEHGIGPGQVGGINAMYGPALWNLFGPQKYGSKVSPQADALFNIFPALRELNSLLVGYSPTTGTFNEGTLTQQAGIGLWATQHVLDRATTAIGLGHAADSPFNLIGKVVPLRDETKSAEQNKAWAYRNSLIMALAPVLDYNYHHRSSEKVWGQSAPANVRGKTINRESIDEIVHSAFPSYDPSVAQSLAVTKQTEMKRYLDDLAASDPQRAAAYQQFVQPAEKLRPILQRAVTDPAKYAQLAAVEADFREYAINLAEQDPKFLTFWNRYYLSTFGPLQAVQ